MYPIGVVGLYPIAVERFRFDVARGSGRAISGRHPAVRSPERLAISPDPQSIAHPHKGSVELPRLTLGQEGDSAVAFRPCQVPLRGPELLSGYGNLSFRPGGRELAFVTTRGVGEVWDPTAGARLFSLGDDGAFVSPTSSISPGFAWCAVECAPAR